MNCRTWKACVSLAMTESCDTSIDSIKSQKTLWKIHVCFKYKNALIVPNMLPKRKPLVFTYVDDIKYDIVKLYNNNITEAFFV